MIRSVISAVFCLGFLFVSCQQKESVKNLPLVETEKPNSDYKPASAGQTRMMRYKTQTPYKVDVINHNLGKPWGISQLPDGNFLITEKSGYINLISKDGKSVTKITGLPKVDSRGQGGLLDIVIDPDFDKNQTIYWSFSEPYEKGNLTSVGKGVLNGNKILNSKVIFRATPSYDGRLHYGSRLAFDKTGNLFVSTGERSDLETRPLAQDLKVYLGKIIKIDKEGKPAAGNPFIGSNKAQPEIFSYGHRNPQGIAIHPETGELWETEMGPRGGDEINHIQAGKNYGWPTITYGIEYSGEKINNGVTKKDGLEQPVYYWDPVISPSGITFYTGNIEEWKNNLFIACLSGEKINRIILENNKVVGEERLLEDQGERFRDVYDGKDGNLYAITDSGKLYRISKK